MLKDVFVEYVAVSKTNGGYPPFPFAPSKAYPEYPFRDVQSIENGVYDAIRRNFILLGYDRPHLGQKDWNPLGFLIQPGMNVFIKPNLVDSRHRFKDDLFSVITHPSVLKCVIDYVIIALRDSGKITIGDNPHVDADFGLIRKACLFDELAAYYGERSGIRLDFIDCRIWQVSDLRYYGYKKHRIRLPGDPEGYMTVDLGPDSLFHGISPRLFRGTYNDRKETKRFHKKKHHLYSFARSIFNADAFISIPKLKSHAKVGATLNIKGLIGTIGEKNGLVHWRIGFPAFGGDEFQNPKRSIDYIKLFIQHLVNDTMPESIILYVRDILEKYRIGRALLNSFLVEDQKKKKLRGAISLNDTTWRTAVDVYHAFLRREGAARPRCYSVIDGVVGGDTDGPHFPRPVHSNVVISGNDFLSTDFVAVRLIDFNYEKIKYLRWLVSEYEKEKMKKGMKTAAHAVGEWISVVSHDFDTADFFLPSKKYLCFRPPHHWEELSLHALAPGEDYQAQGR